MGSKKPLVLGNGNVEQLQSGDNLQLGNAVLDTSQVNTARSLVVPNKDGTIATLDDIPVVGGGTPLSGNNPLAAGTASPGSGTSASRDDHVHPHAPLSYTYLRNLPATVPVAQYDLATDNLPSGAFVRGSSALYTGSDGLLHVAAPNMLRRDYDLATGEYLGALIEDTATNLAPHSNACATKYVSDDPGTGGWYTDPNTSWNGGTCTIVATDRQSPKSGESTAVEVTIPANEGYYYRLNHVPDSGRGYFWSIYAKAVSGDVNRMQLFAASSPSNTGVTYIVSEPKIQGTGWARVYVFAAAVASPTNTSLTFTLFNPTASPITIRIWGLQLERNDVLSSLIETTTAPATRLADDLTFTGAMFPGWTPTKGTAVIDYTPQPWGPYWTYHELLVPAVGSDAFSRVRFGFEYDAQLRRYRYKAGSIVDGATDTNVVFGGDNPPAMSYTGRARIAGSWGGGRIAMAVNGRAESWPATIDTDIDRLKVMHLQDQPSAVESGGAHGWLRSVTLYGDYLSDGELERLTALEVTPYIDRTAPSLIVDGIQGTLDGFYFSRDTTAWRIGPWGTYEEVAANVPRQEWLLNVPQGTLIEGVGAENKFLRSHELTDAAWSTYGLASVSATGTDHVIGSGWNLLTEDTVTQEHGLWQTVTLPASAENFYITLWAIVREGTTCTDFALAIAQSGVPTAGQVFFNNTSRVRTGTYFGDVKFNFVGSNIRQINGVGWQYAATIQVAAGTPSITAGLMMMAAGGGTINYTGTSRTLQVGPMQLELNRYPTSYVPSYATKGVRDPEMVWIKTSDIPRWNTEEFTLLMEAAPCAIPHGTQMMFAHLSDGGVNTSYAEIQVNTDDPRLEMYDGTNQLNLTDADSAKAGVQQWYAIQAKVGFAGLVVDGRVTNGDYFYHYPSNMNVLRLGSRADYNTEDGIAYGGASFWLRYLEVHPRLLPRAELAQRTSRITDGKLERLSMGSNAPSAPSMATGTARNIWIDHTYYDQSFYNIYVVNKLRGPLTGNRVAQGLWVISDVENTQNDRIMSVYGLQGTSRRHNATDTSNNTGNYLAGVIGLTQHAATLPMAAVTGTALSGQNTQNIASGTLLTGYASINQSIAGGGFPTTTTTAWGSIQTQYGVLGRATANSGVGGAGSAYSYAGYVGVSYGGWFSNLPTTTGTNGLKGTIGTAYTVYIDAQPAYATVRSTAPTVAFATTTTITRSDGGSWLTDGFANGNVINVFGSSVTAHNTRHTITAIDATTITCAGSTFTVTAAASGVYLSVGGGIANDKWALYQAGASDKSYFAGKIGIGGSAKSPSSDLHIDNGNATSMITIGTYGDTAKNVTISNTNGKLTLEALNTAGGQGIALKVNGNDALRVDENGDTRVAGHIVFSNGLTDAADDAAAATAGVPVNGLYRNGSVVMVRVA